MTFTIIEGDALKKLEDIEDESVDCVFTSPEPPYNYKEMGELAIMLKTPRVVKSTGSIWVQMGDYHNTDGNMSLIPGDFLRH